ncbi:MAG: primosomal protein N' [Methylophilaceae bacterium]
MKSSEKIINVALNVPVNELFDYLSNDEDIQIGQYVKVPFGRRNLIGIVYSFASSSKVEKNKLKKISYIDSEVLFDKRLLKLLSFVSSYYHYPIGQTIMSVVPARIKQDKSHINRIELLIQPTETLTQEVINALPKRQVRLRKLAQKLLEGPIRQSNLSKTISSPLPLIKVLEKANLCTTLEWQLKSDSLSAEAIPKLNSEQEIVISKILNHNGYKAWLVHGVTGSGKTEIYLNLIEKLLKKNLQSLILVPEINLTPQLESRFLRRFYDKKIVVLHSFLSDRERLKHWQQAKSGEADIVIGTRLAIFTPIKNLGLIIVDEEHDASFKQQEGLRYHARDVALVRGKELNIPVVMGTATPSLESWLNTKQTVEKFDYLRLTKRAISEAKLPSIKLIPYAKDKYSTRLSQELLKAIEERIKKRQQVLIFINRRGYAPVLVCTSCGWTPKCHRCSAKLVYHRQQNKLRCHHCDHQQVMISQCLDCGNLDLLPLGKGTQRLEDELENYFPKANILRVDRDTMRSKKALNDLYTKVNEGDVDILVGTQILSKGHDFKNLSLVIILEIDHALYSTNFRSTERIFSQLTQVSGRSGRALIEGDVLIQTNFPNHPIFHYLKNHDFSGYADLLLEERKQMNLIPYSYMAILTVQAKAFSCVEEFIDKAIAEIGKIKTEVNFFGPVRPTLERLKGFERVQIIFQSNDRNDLHRFLGQWMNAIQNLTEIKRVKFSLDVDPIDF